MVNDPDSFVSRLHAELRVEGGEMHFYQIKASFSFINEMPMHVRSAGRPSSMRVFNGDMLRTT